MYPIKKLSKNAPGLGKNSKKKGYKLSGQKKSLENV